MYKKSKMCVLAKKCLTRFTHLSWIFARAQGWVGHLSDLYQYEYVKPYTNVNIENLKQTRMGSGWADFVKHTTPLFLLFSKFLSFWLILPRIYNSTCHDFSCMMYTFIFPPVCPIPHFLLIDTGGQMNSKFVLNNGDSSDLNNYKTSNLVDHRGRVDHYVLRERKQLKGRTDSATFDIVRMWNNCTGRTQIWNEVWHYSSFLGRTAITGSNTLFFFSKSLVLLNV